MAYFLTWTAGGRSIAPLLDWGGAGSCLGDGKSTTIFACPALAFSYCSFFLRVISIPCLRSSFSLLRIASCCFLKTFSGGCTLVVDCVWPPIMLLLVLAFDLLDFDETELF